VRGRDSEGILPDGGFQRGKLENIAQDFIREIVKHIGKRCCLRRFTVPAKLPNIEQCKIQQLAEF